MLYVQVEAAVIGCAATCCTYALKNSASVSLLSGSHWHTSVLHSGTTPGPVWHCMCHSAQCQWILFMQRYVMLYVRTLAAADLPVVQYGIQSSYYSLRSYMLHVRTSSSFLLKVSLLNGSRKPVLLSGMTPVWPLDMVYAALHAVRTHFCERPWQPTEWQPHTSLAFKYDTSLACNIWFTQRYMLYVRTASSRPGPVWHLGIIDYAATCCTSKQPS